MRRKKVLCMLIMASRIVMIGCAKNPDSDEVVNKNEGIFEEALNDTEVFEPERKEYSYEASFIVGNQNITVTGERLMAAPSILIWDIKQENTPNTRNVRGVFLNLYKFAGANYL